MGADPEALKKMEAKMNASKGDKPEADKAKGMSDMMATMGKKTAQKEYSKEEINFALALTEVERTIRNVGNYQTELTASPEKELASLVNALNGGYTAPSPGGDPIANPNTLPTGRNMYAINAEATPSESAWEKELHLPSKPLKLTNAAIMTVSRVRSVTRSGPASLLKREELPSHKYCICSV